MTRVAYIVLAAGAVVTLSFMFRAGVGNSVDRWLVAIPFAAWAMLPYVVAGAAIRNLRGSPRSTALLLIVAILLTSTAAALLYQSLVVHIDPQSALVFVFLPLWQLVGLAPFLFVAFVLRARSSSGPPA